MRCGGIVLRFAGRHEGAASLRGDGLQLLEMTRTELDSHGQEPTFPLALFQKRHLLLWDADRVQL